MDEALRRAEVPVDPAEIHGSLCGLLCVLGSAGKSAWLADTLADSSDPEEEDEAEAGLESESVHWPEPDPAVRDGLMAAMDALAGATAGALEAAAMDFQPLLPGDDEALADRVDGLAQWCQGFNHGLYVAAHIADAHAELDSGDTAEIIRDFAELAQAGMDGEAADADGEAAYAELVEFVRVSVQLVYEELTAARLRVESAARH